MLRQLADDLWIADMANAPGGFAIGARMTVVRLPGDRLWLHSPVALTDTLRGELESHGAVCYLVSPARFHYGHVREYATAYPDAEVHAVAGSIQRLAGLNARLLNDIAPEGWRETLEQSAFRGSGLYDEVDFYHASSRTLILTDLLFNIPASSGWLTRIQAGALGILGRPAASRTFHFSARNREHVRESLRRILEWDFDRILFSHGDYVESDGRAVFEHAYRRYL